MQGVVSSASLSASDTRSMVSMSYLSVPPMVPHAIGFAISSPRLGQSLPLSKFFYMMILLPIIDSVPEKEILPSAMQ